MVEDHRNQWDMLWRLDHSRPGPDEMGSLHSSVLRSLALGFCFPVNFFLCFSVFHCSLSHSLSALSCHSPAFFHNPLQNIPSLSWNAVVWWSHSQNSHGYGDLYSSNWGFKKRIMKVIDLLSVTVVRSCYALHSISVFTPLTPKFSCGNATNLHSVAVVPSHTVPHFSGTLFFYIRHWYHSAFETSLKPFSFSILLKVMFKEILARWWLLVTLICWWMCMLLCNWLLIIYTYMLVYRFVMHLIFCVVAVAACCCF